MDKLMESVFEWITNTIINGVVFVVNFFAQISTGQFGIETDSFKEMFDPNGNFLPQVIDIFMYTGVGLCIVMLCWNLFKGVFGPLTSVREHPMVLVGKTFIAIFFSIKGIEIIETIVFAMMRIPYAELSGLKVDTTISVTAESIKSVSNIGDAANIVGDTFLTGSGIGWFTIFVIILLIVICYKFFKLVIELIERYLLMNVLVFASPLVGCTLISEKTSSIFNGFCKMLGGQMILILFNVISMQLVSAGLSGALQNSAATAGIGDSMWVVTINLFAVIALINVSQRFDSYLNQIGLNAGITGGEMLGRDMIPLMNMMNGRGGMGFVGKMGKSAVGAAGKAAGEKAGKKINGEGAKKDVGDASKQDIKPKGKPGKGTGDKTANPANEGGHNGATLAERIIKNAGANGGAPVKPTNPKPAAKPNGSGKGSTIKNDVNSAESLNSNSNSSTTGVENQSNSADVKGATINSDMSSTELSNASSSSGGSTISSSAAGSVSQSTNTADTSNVTNVGSSAAGAAKETHATSTPANSPHEVNTSDSSKGANNETSQSVAGASSSHTTITAPVNTSVNSSQTKSVKTTSTTKNGAKTSQIDNKSAVSHKIVQRNDTKK